MCQRCQKFIKILFDKTVASLPDANRALFQAELPAHSSILYTARLLSISRVVYIFREGGSPGYNSPSVLRRHSTLRSHRPFTVIHRPAALLREGYPFHRFLQGAQGVTADLLPGLPLRLIGISWRACRFCGIATGLPVPLAGSHYRGEGEVSSGL